MLTDVDHDNLQTVNNKNIADVQQSNPKQWWSAVKRSLASLLLNLFNDKFVAVGSSLPPLNWCPLPVDVYPPKFIVSVEETETALLSSNSILPLVPMKYQRRFFARTHLFCVVHYAPFSIRLFVKASFLPCENQPKFYQFQNLLPPPTSIQTFVLFHLPLFSVKSWNTFLTASFFSQFQTKSIPSSSVLNEDQAQAWLSSTSCINGTKHVMILDHHYGSAY